MVTPKRIRKSAIEARFAFASPAGEDVMADRRFTVEESTGFVIISVDSHPTIPAFATIGASAANDGETARVLLMVSWKVEASCLPGALTAGGMGSRQYCACAHDDLAAVCLTLPCFCHLAMALMLRRSLASPS
jgi:hypothetical protein